MNHLKLVLAFIMASTFSTSAFTKGTEANFLKGAPKVYVDNVEYYQLDDMLISTKESAHTNKMDANVPAWTDGKVVYEFAPDVTAENRQNFVAAAQIWAEIANLEFIERTTEANHIYITNDNKNFATVGMVGGRQTLAMVSWGTQYVIVHELGHSLGMWHEQMRSDRDDYVTINIDNIDPDQRYNFTKRNTNNLAEYDFQSVMHYGQYAWTQNSLPTITVKPGYEKYTELLGQNSYISAGDQLAAARTYGAKIIEIPDAAFKNYLVAQFDDNADGEIDSIEAALVTQIQTPGAGEITSLEGIQFFRGLKSLSVASENISAIEQRLPPALEYLDISNNAFSELNTAWSFPPLMNSILASGNPLDVYACETVNFINATLGAGAIVVSPNSDGDNIVCDEQSANQLLSGKPRLDQRQKGSRTYFINVPENVAELRVETSLFDGQVGGLMDVYVSYEATPSSTSYDYFSANSGNEELVLVNNPQAGTWYITLEPNDRSFEFVNITATLSNGTQTNNLLENGVAKSALTGEQGDSLAFEMIVPENASNLRFQLSGGSGDADLYVRYAAKPTLSVYDCRPWKNGNNESCPFSSPQAGTYYVTVYGYSQFDNVQLLATYDEGSAPTGDSVEYTDIADNQGGWKYVALEIPAGMTQLSVSITGGSGDADLYLRRASQPTTGQFDCRPYKTGNEELCTISNPAAGTWYVGIRAYAKYSGVTLRAEWQ